MHEIEGGAELAQPVQATTQAQSLPLRVRLRRIGINDGMFFVLPAFLVYAGFVVYPIVETLRLSVFKWDGVHDQKFVGFANYVKMFTNDDIFLIGVRNTLYWMVVSVPLQLVLGLSLALLLNQQLKGRTFYRSVFFSPATISIAVIAAVWGRILGPPNLGTFNEILALIGLGHFAHGWLGDVNTSIFAAIIVNTWRFVGFTMVLYLAALQSIPLEYYEASRVDGANVWAQIRYVTIPLLMPMTVTLTMLGVIRTMREFELLFVLTRGGPAHQSELVSLHIYNQAFLFAKFGYASSIAVVLMIATIILTIIQLRLYNAYGRIGR
jgi:raffinose/stachyose/melibiose transport system permease protein